MRNRITRPKSAFAIIPNAAMRDTDLSIEARGFLALLMTYSDGWEFITGHLMKVAQVGRDKFQRIMGELETAGYVRREIRRGEGGRLAGSRWVINDSPEDDGEPENPALGANTTEGLKNRQPVKPTVGKPGPIRRSKEKEDQKEDVLDVDEGQIPPALDDAFQALWQAYPRVRDPARTRKLFADAVKAGADPDRIVRAAKRYAAENAGNSTAYIAYSTSWIEQRRWEDYSDTLPPKRAEDSVAPVARYWAEVIASGGFVPSSAISPSLADYMLAKKLVPVADLRRLGLC